MTDSFVLFDEADYDNRSQAGVAVGFELDELGGPRENGTHRRVRKERKK